MQEHLLKADQNIVRKMIVTWYNKLKKFIFKNFTYKSSGLNIHFETSISCIDVLYIWLFK